jgi:putative flippase GtrA
MIKLLLSKIDKKFQKFLIVGVINTIFSYSLYAFFLSLGIHYGVAVLLSTILGVLFNFKTIGKFVFNNGSNRLIFKFIAPYVVIYFLNIGSLRVFDFFDFNMYFAGFIVTIYLSLVSFYLNKKFVFNQKINV